MRDGKTTISVTHSTKERLKKYCQKGEAYETAIVRLLEVGDKLGVITIE